MQEVQEMLAWSLGREDALEKEVATHSSILAWKIPWTEEPGGLVGTHNQPTRSGLKPQWTFIISFISSESGIQEFHGWAI